MTTYVRAMYDFNGEQDSSEISISAGEILIVTRTDVGDGWWEGRNNAGSVGLFPEAYVEVMSVSDVDKYLDKCGNNKNYRYDQTTDENIDCDDWEDDWDDETYSEIGPISKQPLTLSDLTSSYDKNLPIVPNEDIASKLSSTNVTNATTLKRSGMFARTWDSYILGLATKERLPEGQIVHIIQIDGFYHWEPNHQSYSVLVASPKKESKFKGMKTFIAYQLTPSFNNISVSRRYKHFDWLHERLVEKFCLIPIPPLPDKQISGRYEEQFIEHRRVQLQEFVDWVCRHPVLSKCEVWYHFLTCIDEKAWKLGKRKAEKDVYVGMTYCWAISPPEKQLLPSFVESQIESFTQFIHSMDISVKNLLMIANDIGRKYQTQNKKEFQRIGDGLSDLAKSLNIDERRLPSKSDVSMSEKFGRIGGMFIAIGQMYGDQPKLDWIPFSDRLHIYRGILGFLPEVLSTHKGAIQKRKECERLAAEQKLGNQQMSEVNRRTDVISYAVMSEISHFKTEREIHLRDALKCFLDEQIKFYTSIIGKLQEAYQQFEQ